jgi:hypothetical protein
MGLLHLTCVVCAGTKSELEGQIAGVRGEVEEQVGTVVDSLDEQLEAAKEEIRGSSRLCAMCVRSDLHDIHGASMLHV